MAQIGCNMFHGKMEGPVEVESNIFLWVIVSNE